MKSSKAGKATFPEEFRQSIRGTAPEAIDSTLDNKPEELSDRFCDLCIEDGQNATANVYCGECEQSLCERCLKSHQRGKFTRDHETVRLDSQLENRAPEGIKIRKSEDTKVTQKQTVTGECKANAALERKENGKKCAIYSSELQITEIGEDTAIVCAMEFLQDGKIIVCDSGNNKIKLVGANDKIVSSISLTSKPGGLVLLSETSFMLSLPLENCLQIGMIENGKQLNLVSKANTSKRYYRLVSYQPNTIVQAEDDAKRFIFVMDKSGKEVKRIVTDTKGLDEKFSVIRYICRNPRYQAIYVTDNKLGCTCITMDGEIVASFKEENSKTHWGICCDKDGYVYVTCPDQHKVVMLDSKGEKLKDLIFSKGMDPGFIAYNQHLNSLYVWSDQKKRVLVYKILI